MTKKRLLCVEDEQEICNLVTSILEDFDIVSARTFAKAKELIAVEKFDVYLIDNFLPDGTGFELCRIIRAADARTPILFMSGLGAMTSAEIEEAGAQGFISKGASFVDVLESLVNKFTR